MSSNATLHLLCGKAGAGKTTLATALAAAHKAIIIAEDIWLIRLYGPMTSFDDYRTYSQRAKSVVGPLVTDLLGLGQSVVLDYPANTKSSRLWLRSLAESAGAHHLLHYLATPNEICLERIDQRNIERPEGSYHLTKDDFDYVSSFFEAPEVDEGLKIELHASDA
jgi:predicted kinase